MKTSQTLPASQLLRFPRSKKKSITCSPQVWHHPSDSRPLLHCATFTYLEGKASRRALKLFCSTAASPSGVTPIGTHIYWGEPLLNRPLCLLRALRGARQRCQAGRGCNWEGKWFKAAVV